MEYKLNYLCETRLLKKYIPAHVKIDYQNAVKRI